MAIKKLTGSLIEVKTIEIPEVNLLKKKHERKRL